MKRFYLFFLVIFFFLACNNEGSIITIEVTGDIILDRGVKDQIELYGSDLLDTSIGNIKQGDFLLVNYEGTFTSSRKAQTDKYNFRAKPNIAKILYAAGVTHISLANNHSFDYWQSGFDETLRTIRENKMKPVGYACKTEIISAKGVKVGLISASLVTSNKHLCITNKKELKNHIVAFIRDKPNIPLLLYLHWGHELQPSPEQWQRDLAAEFIDLGVDGIFGHHPHIIQTIEFIDNKPVFYSLGNFIADAYLPKTTTGLVAHLEITQDAIKTYLNFIKLYRYFPHIADSLNLYIKAYQNNYFADNVCVIPCQNKLMLKPVNNVSFKASFDEWYFYGQEALVMVKKFSEDQYLFRVIQQDDASNAITVYGKLSELEVTDINNDGSLDILLGITKKVNFDPNFNKRIQIYTLKNNILQPLWLGTKFIDEVISFEIEDNGDIKYLKIKEKNRNGQILFRDYIWEEFGFALKN